MVTAWRAVRLGLFAPLMAAGLGVTALFVSAVAVGVTAEWLTFPLWTAATVGAAVLLARLGHWWALPQSRITTVAVTATAPAFLACNLMYVVSSSVPKLDRHGPAYVLFFGGLAVLLHLVDRLNSTGRRRAAWWAGGLGALALADAAVALTMILAGHTEAAFAPVWLFSSLLETSFGLGGLDTVVLLDIVELDPPIYILAAGMALGPVMARRPLSR